MYVICVDFHIKLERLADFMPLMKQQAANSLKLETACQRFDICVDPKAFNKIFLYEVYDDERAFATHLASEHFLDFDQAVSEMITEKTVRSFTLI